MRLVVVGLRADLCVHKLCSQSKHRHLLAQNRRRTHPPHHPLDLPYFHRTIQLVLLLSFHFPMLARFVLLGTVQGWRGKMHRFKHCRQLVLRLLGVELRHRLDIQYCSNLHRSWPANEPTEEDYCGYYSCILCHVSRFTPLAFVRILNLQ